MLTDRLHLGSDDTVNSHMAAIAEAALQATAATGVAIALGSDGAIVCRGRAGSAAPDIGVQLHGSSGITGQCVISGEVVYCQNAEEDSRVNAEACEELGVKSIIAIPLWLDGKVVGVLEAMSDTAHAFGAEQRAALNQFAGRIIERLVPPGPEPVSEDDAFSQAAISRSPAVIPEPDASIVLLSDEPAVSVWSMGFFKAAVALVALIAVALLAMLFSRTSRTAAASLPAPPVEAAVHQSVTLLPVVGAPVLEEQPPAPEAEPALNPRGAVDSASDAQPPSIAALETAAREGSPDAQYQLAKAFATGAGVPADVIEAYAWYIAAGLSGNPRTQAPLRSLPRQLTDRQIAQVRFRVAQMYSAGDGLPKDFISAYSWLVLAGAAGHPEASREAAALAAHMTGDEIAEANSRAQTWLARHGQGSR